MKWNFLYQITAASRTPDQGATAPRSPFSLSSALNWIRWTPPGTKFLGTPLVRTPSFATRGSHGPHGIVRGAGKELSTGRYLDRKNKVAGMTSGWASVRWVATMARKWMSVAPRLDRTQRLRLQKLPVDRTSRLQASWWHGVIIPIKQSSTTASRKSHDTFHIHFKRDEIICGKKYYKLCTVFSYRGVVYLLDMLYFKMSCVYCC
jgi:hypothetical protein